MESEFHNNSGVPEIFGNSRICYYYFFSDGKLQEFQNSLILQTSDIPESGGIKLAVTMHSY